MKITKNYLRQVIKEELEAVLREEEEKIYKPEEIINKIEQSRFGYDIRGLEDLGYSFRSIARKVKEGEKEEDIVFENGYGNPEPDDPKDLYFPGFYKGWTFEDYTKVAAAMLERIEYVKEEDYLQGRDRDRIPD